MSIVDIMEYLDTAYWHLSTLGDEPLDELDALPEDISDLWNLRQEIMLAARALQAIRGQIEERIGDQLQKGEAVNVRGEIIRYKAGFKRRIHDERRLWDFVQSLPADAITELFNPNDIRIGQLKVKAKERLGLDAAAVEDTFYVKEFTPARVEGVPKEHAPIWTQEMDDGERKVSPYVRDDD